MSEVFPNRLRAQGRILGGRSHWISNAPISLVFPLIITVFSSFPFSFFAGMTVLDLVLVLFLYPETAGVSLKDM